MFSDFKNAVLNAYAEKKESRLLSENLLRPTKAKLRQECLSILKNRYDKKDDEVINGFFNPEGKYENHEISISKFELDGFAALRNFLLGQKDIRREETIKLLAWLIDFEPRPYRFDETYEVEVVEVSVEDVTVAPERTETTEESQERVEEDKEIVVIDEDIPIIKGPIPWYKRPLAYASAIVLSLLLIAPIAYNFIGGIEGVKDAAASEAILQNETKQIPVKYIKNTEVSPSNTKPSTRAKKECMYWAGDHYEAIDCNEEIGDTAKFVINLDKVTKFKKINTPDTLTKNSIGKVYYLKTNNKIEYFTEEGFHPVLTERKLKKLSSYILNKYISNKP